MAQLPTLYVPRIAGGVYAVSFHYASKGGDNRAMAIPGTLSHGGAVFNTMHDGKNELTTYMPTISRASIKAVATSLCSILTELRDAAKIAEDVYISASNAVLNGTIREYSKSVAALHSR